MKKVSLFLLSFLLLSLSTVKNAYAVGGSLLLSPATYTVNSGETFKVDILVDTGGTASVSRVKSVLSFDTTTLQVVDDVPTVVGTQIKPGPLFTTAASTNTVDTVTGKITYDTGTLSPAYTGRGVLASITFKALAAGITRPSFSFSTSQITSTTGENILDIVNDGTYTIGGTTGAVSVSPTPVVTTTTTTTTKGGLPVTGAVENTLAVLALAGVFFLTSWVFGKKVV